LSSIGLYIGHHHLGARPGQGSGDRSTDTLAGAGDQCDLVR
jgi:hypothetical protein